jgi:YhcH/YjgK/YiaL family protein
MIFSNISDISNYNFLNISFRKALRFIKNNDFSNYDNGRYEIDGDRIFAIINEYIPKLSNEIIWETHELYADIHYVFNGEEKINLSNLIEMESISDYIPEKDAIFYKGHGQSLILKNGDFLIIFPKEVHAAGIASTNSVNTKKIVIKVKLFNEK